MEGTPNQDKQPMAPRTLEDKRRDLTARIGTLQTKLADARRKLAGMGRKTAGARKRGRGRR